MSRLILIAGMVILSNYISGQHIRKSKCYDPSYHENCFYLSKSIFDDYVYLKSRPFTQEAQGVKYIVNLKKNTLYLFNICEGEDAKVVIKLYDVNSEDEPVATTYNESEKKYTQILSYYSKSGGSYSLSVSFEKAEQNCAVVVCGMIRKNIDTYVKLPDQL